MSHHIDADRLIQDNIERHERIAQQYDARHGEIYNATEQKRLFEALQYAVSCQTSSSDHPHALDFGCGSGNLTRHLLALGCRVTTADVTPSFVTMASDIDPVMTTGHVLNGRDLSEFADDTFDIVATYSVLHHVPDYLLAVREMARVTRPGGVILIDHERSEEYWEPTHKLTEFYGLFTEHRPLSWYLRRLVSPKWYVKRFKKTIDPRYQEEGDIHVWPDDHIEWAKIKAVLHESNTTIVRDETYLLCEARYDLDTYKQYASECVDTRLLIVQKQ